MSTSLHIVCSASSPFSFMKRPSRSTTMNTEFHRVGTGRMTIRPQVSLMVSAARVDLPALFQMAWHLQNVDLDNLLYAVLSSACWASVVQMRFSG